MYTFLLWVVAAILLEVAYYFVAALQQATGSPLSWVFYLGTAAFALWDGLRIPLKKYKSIISYGLLGLFLSFFLLWPIGLPMYLVMKFKIWRGTARLKDAAEQAERKVA